MPHNYDTPLIEGLQDTLETLDLLSHAPSLSKFERDRAWKAAIHVRAVLGYFDLHDCGVDLKTLSAGR